MKKSKQVLRQLSKSQPFGRCMSLPMAVVLAMGAVGSISEFAKSQPPVQRRSRQLLSPTVPNSQFSAEQQASLKEAERLTKQVIELYNKGQHDAAISLAKPVLAIYEKVLGSEHPSVGLSLSILAELYRVQGNYQQAETLYKRALAIKEKALGPEHPLVATSLNQLALLYRQQGNYQLAEPLYKRALAIRKKALGVEGSIPRFAKYQPPLRLLPTVPRSQLSVEQQASLEDTERLIKQVMELYNKGKYDAAIPLTKHVLAIYEKVLGQEHSRVAASLSILASLYSEQENYQQAEPLLKRSLAITEKVLGSEHPLVATSVSILANLYSKQGSYQLAEPLLKALAQSPVRIPIKELPRINPPELPPVGGTVEVPTRSEQQGQTEAEQLYSQALELYNAGKDDAAISLTKRALVVTEKVLGLEHPSDVNYLEQLIYLNKLASLYQTLGSYQQAEALLKRSLAMTEKALGLVQSPAISAISLSDLAELYKEQGNYQQAETLYKYALTIAEKALSQGDVAKYLNDLAKLYRDQGNYQQAEPLLKRALAIKEKALSLENPMFTYQDFAFSLRNLAQLYLAQGNVTRAIDLLQHGLEVEEKNLALILAVGSEEYKKSFMEQLSHPQSISLALQFAPNDSKAAKLALTTVLQRKGRVLDALADIIQILRSQQANKLELKQLFDEWLSIIQQQSALVYGEKATSQLYKDRFEQLSAQRQELVEAMSKQSAEFRHIIQPVELDAIQAKIPKDTAMVEIVQYKPFNVKAKNIYEQWGNLRYAAAVMRSHGEPKWVDLGKASDINKSVASLRVALSTQQGERSSFIVKPISGKQKTDSLQQLARTLDRQVMEPIRTLLGDAKHIIISPEGQLSLIPFEALVDEKGQYLIQRYMFSYLTTGRDLLRFPSTANNNSAPIVFADIDYDKQQTVATLLKPAARGNTSRRSNDLASDMRFGKLKNTQLEAEQIKAIFPQTTILSGSSATEAAIKQLSAPSILHLATHGFFLTDQQIQPKFNNYLQQSRRVFGGENPLLRSGLALAGFNSRNQSSSADDGVLTSLEVAGLNLRGTQLVVLSACETGLGDISVGDGLYGLRRALTIAGSQSQVLSLWKVDDAGTKDLMVKYYQKLKAGKGRHEALREAQLEMLSTPKYQHPKYWASFVASGDWTPLSQ